MEEMNMLLQENAAVPRCKLYGGALRGVLCLRTVAGIRGGLWAFQDERFMAPPPWSDEGLHVLKDGDELTILSKTDPSMVEWHGTVRLRHSRPLAEYYLGRRLNAEQTRVPMKRWAYWFLHVHPAVLLPAH